MGKGIALEIKERYGHQTYLRSLKKQVCEVATLSVGKRNYIFYLCTKPKSRQFPRLTDLKKSLQNLLSQCKDLGVKEIVIPRIVTFNDRLQWSDVVEQINSVFVNSIVKLIVFDTPEDMQRQTSTTRQTRQDGAAFEYQPQLLRSRLLSRTT